MYEITKHLHLTIMLVSVLLFLSRFVLTIRGSNLLNKKALKIAPHIIDTIWIITAVALCVMLQQYPFVNGWVTEKLLAFVMYIFMVLFALKLAKTNLMRFIGLVGAISWLAFAGMVAVTKQAYLFG
ncbi:SirB2 family protein [Flavobacterium sp. W21_SRS_FM6]|uniref:SirB2 family protein n=1 Tax=Flavobacterium sp. W21_SRS_FM6 TaxID=3240268 RepID=UPI003F91A408